MLSVLVSWVMLKYGITPERFHFLVADAVGDIFVVLFALAVYDFLYGSR